MGRVRLNGIGARNAHLRFCFNGRDIAAAPGESIAAALAVAGELSLRQTREGDMRGPFCGMGLCHECLVSIDGETVRACMTPAKDGMNVRHHEPRLARARQVVRQSLSPLSADIVVVGAGPAGLAAACMAAVAGLDVIVVDERKQPGGQYHKQPAAEFSVTHQHLDHQFRQGRALARQAEAAGVRMLPETCIWAQHGDHSLLIDGPDGARRLDARRIILASGGAERCPPFPGWTLPGVMTTGAAQTFLRAYGVVAGARVLVAGAGPLNLQLAAELIRAGIHVAGVAEASSGMSAGKLPAVARMIASGPRLVGQGLGYRAVLLRAGVKIWHRTVVAAALGENRLASVSLLSLGQDGSLAKEPAIEIACDLLCVGYGFNPAVELPAAMGCALEYDARWRHLAVTTDAEGRTSLPHVFAVGDGARFAGAEVAMAMGKIAGAAAARDLLDKPSSNTAQGRRVASTLAAARAFQAALWTFYAAPVLTHELATADTLICRCEHVSKGMIDDARRAGATSLGAIKRATRLGMGRCQGRYCAGVTAALLVDTGGRAISPDVFFAPRTPLRPVSIGAIAATDLGAGE